MKMFRSLFILTFFLTLTTASGQKIITYKIWITQVNQNQTKGILYSANKDELVILGEDLTQITFLPENIQVIKLRREGKSGKGAWIGGLGGLVIGAAAGYAIESGSGWEDVGAVGGGLLGVPIGAIAGALIGSNKERYNIHGDIHTYYLFLPKLQKYAPQNSP